MCFVELCNICVMITIDDHDLQEDEKTCSEWLHSERAAIPSCSGTSSQLNTKSFGRGSSFKNTFGFLNDSEKTESLNEVTSNVIPTAHASAFGSGKAIIVNPCQKGNPVLDLIYGVPWKYADSSIGLAVDYILGPSTGCLFLSLRYHSLKPDYIYERLKTLRQGGLFALRLLLCLVDVKDSVHSVRELTKVCLISDVTLLLAFSNDEAATYLETFKAYQNKPADLLKLKPSSNYQLRAIDVLSSIRSVNSTDSNTLLSNFGSIAEISKANEEELGLCPGIGGKKAQSLFNVFREPFLKKKTL